MGWLESVAKSRQRLLAVPEGQRYSCRRCGWCCRWWKIEVTPEERERLLQHDWSSESARLRGLSLFCEQRPPGRSEPSIQTVQLNGQCVFLEEDNLCLIHKVLSEEAKPAGCRRFPVRLGWLHEGIVIGVDYACPAAITSDGAPFEEYLGPVLDRLASGGPELACVRPVEIELHLSPGVPISWQAYLDIEGSLLDILRMPGRAATRRLAGVRALLSCLAGNLPEYLGADVTGARLRLAENRSLAASGAGSVDDSVLRTIAQMAPAIGDMETSHSSTSGRGSAAIGYALSIARGTGSLYLQTLHSTVDLDTLGRVECDLDAPQFDALLTRFLSNYVMRKSLLESPDLEAGCEYLGLCLSLVQWYARVSAASEGRMLAARSDVIAGIQVVEKAYVP
jgi:Fe-S-cluster containining protein